MTDTVALTQTSLLHPHIWCRLRMKRYGKRVSVTAAFPSTVLPSGLNYIILFIMTNNEKFDLWLEKAERDLDAAGAMFDSGRWFYVIFMCQQAIEKIVKGLYVQYVDDNVPRTHNIGLLINRFEDRLPAQVEEKYYLLFETLSKHYLADRYPVYISISGEQISKKYAEDILKNTKEVFQWLLALKM